VKKYVLDTNIFIQADRDRAFAEQLLAFYAAWLPATYLHAVVVQELLMGAVDARRRKSVYEGYIAPFERRERIITPSYGTWQRSGGVLGVLVDRRRLSPGGFSRSFLNDVLLALSCREAGAILVTANERDFALISSVERIEFTAPWPGV
jgi:predicted nucleic acid-binding protein